jgi:heparan-alpha-glucosaminide N-acetyltransferase
MSTAQKPVPTRVVSVDAFRGFVMLLMMAEVLELAHVARAFPESGAWRFLAHHQTHAAWAGCSLHDLIQPSFSFLVGVALPFSLASRMARGQPLGRLTAHAAWRAVLLVALGVFLRSIGRAQTYFTFEDTLSQIGLGYLPLFLLGLTRPRWWWVALAVILVGYWAAFALYPLPGSDFDYASVGVLPDGPQHYAGWAAHWNKNSNLAWAFDRWFLNLFPRETPFTHNGGGYATLSFIPTLGTMMLGLIAGDRLRRDAPAWERVRWLVVAGLVCLGVGGAADYFGICPSVKRIWTPAWTLWSGGWCFLLLAGFYAILDAARMRAWAFPLVVVGMNSIAAYCMAHLIGGFVIGSFKTHLGPQVFATWGTGLEPFVRGCAVLAVYWLILYWMYRRGIFLRV